MKIQTKTIPLTILLCAATVLGAGCAGADDKPKEAAKADPDIHWGAPVAAQDPNAPTTGLATDHDLPMSDDFAALWDEMERMQRSMMGSFGGFGSGGASFGGWSRPQRMSVHSFSSTPMNADVAETDKEYIISCELPGVRKEDIKIDVDGSTLLVQAVRNAGTDRSGAENGQKFHYRERSYGTTQRRFRIGSGVDPKKIKADLKDGILTIRVPKGADHTYQVPISG